MRIEILALTLIMFSTAFSAQAGLVIQCGNDPSLTSSISGRPELASWQGAWIGKSGSVTLARRISDDQLELRGQDSASYWNARCDRSKTDPTRFVCVGTGEEFEHGKAFELRSTLTLSCPPIVEDWVATFGGKEMRSGRDEMVPLRPKTETVSPGARVQTTKIR